LDLDPGSLPPQMSFADWPELRRIFTERFASKSQEDWSQVFDGTDACVTPVLSFQQVSSHPHNQERKTPSSRTLTGKRVLVRLRFSPELLQNRALRRSLYRRTHGGSAERIWVLNRKKIEQMMTHGVVEGDAIKAKL
ncbi:hypothetical protein KUCAC02_035394, partial [Chaenocephalus aceratus]